MDFSKDFPEQSEEVGKANAQKTIDMIFYNQYKTCYAPKITPLPPFRFPPLTLICQISSICCFL